MLLSSVRRTFCAGDRLRLPDGLQGVPGRVADDRLAAGPARELLVEEQFDAGEPLVLRAGEPQDLCRRALERVGPPLLFVAPDARQVERQGGCGELGVDLARDVGEPLLLPLAGDQRLFDGPAFLAAVDLQRVAELVRRRARVVQKVRIRVHGLLRLAYREFVPVSVEDRPAVRRQHDLIGLLVERERREVLRRRGERDGLAADEHEKDDEDEAEEPDAAVDTSGRARLAAPHEAAAAPAGRATTSCRGSRHQRFAATSTTLPRLSGLG